MLWHDEKTQDTNDIAISVQLHNMAACTVSVWHAEAVQITESKYIAKMIFQQLKQGYIK